MPFSNREAEQLAKQLWAGYFGENVYEAFRVLTGQQKRAIDIPQEVIDTIIRLELGKMELALMAFRAEGKTLKQVQMDDCPVLILTRRGRMVARHMEKL